MTTEGLITSTLFFRENVVQWRQPTFADILHIGSFDEVAIARLVLKSYNGEPVATTGGWPDMRPKDVGVYVRLVMERVMPSPEQTAVALAKVEHTADGWRALTPGGRTVRHREPTVEEAITLFESTNVVEQLRLMQRTLVEVDGEAFALPAKWPFDCIDSTCLWSCMRQALFPTAADVAHAKATTSAPEPSPQP